MCRGFHLLEVEGAAANGQGAYGKSASPRWSTPHGRWARRGPRLGADVTHHSSSASSSLASRSTCLSVALRSFAVWHRAVVALALAVTSGCTTSHDTVGAGTDAGPLDAAAVAIDSPAPADAATGEDAGVFTCEGGASLVVRTPDGEFRFDSAYFGVRHPECTQWLELYFARAAEWSCGDPVATDVPGTPDGVLALLWLPPPADGWQSARTWLSVHSMAAAFTTQVQIVVQEDPAPGRAGALTGRIHTDVGTPDGWSLEGCFDAAYCERLEHGCR